MADVVEPGPGLASLWSSVYHCRLPDSSEHCLQVAEDIDGKEHIMREYKGKVLLITNVASECGFTESNYKGLQQVYDKYHDRGLEVQPLQSPA